MKIFFYGHTAGMGAGHFVRSLRLAAAAKARGCEVLVTSPGPELSVLNREEVPTLALTPLQGLSTDLSVVERRGKELLDGLRAWRPDMVVVDTLPFGQGGELLSVLTAAHQEAWDTQFWWGLPYAESPHVRGLKNPRLRKAISGYRGVLVYGEKGAYDPVPAYREFPLPAEIHHVGMVTESLDISSGQAEPTIACLVGSGGLDGAAKLVEVLRSSRPEGVRIRYVPGPLARCDARAPEGVEVVPEADLSTALSGVSAVVSRVGYNTAYSLMKTDLPTLFLPTAWPEQFQRAEELSELESVLVCRESEMESHLKDRLASLMELPKVSRRLPFRTDGAANAANVLLASVKEAPL